MTELLFGVLLQGLKLWNTAQANKYIDEVYELQKDWLKEYEKPRKDRDNSNLDYIEQRLQLLSKLFTTTAGKKDD